MPFSQVIAQERAVASLRSSLRRGTLHHAYLFAGPEGVGKGRVATLLAQAANCEGGTAGPHGYRDDPCGRCLPCVKIEKGAHPDVARLADERAMVKAGRWEPKSGRTPSRDIVVDQVRDLVDHRLSLHRFEGRRRFVIIDPADAMNAQAQNALLKTLEEPPDATTIVLVASAADSLLPTIRSRCLRVAFRPLPPAPLDEAASGERREVVERVAGLEPGDPVGWLSLARDVGGKREAAEALCELLLVWLRDVAVVQAGGGELALAELEPVTRSAASGLAMAEPFRRRDGVKRVLAALRQNAQPVLAMERLFIGWFHGRS